ncbi:unnamed protein product, partial [Schistosoma mattheei]
SSFYKLGESFTCLDGSSAIPWWQVNDDYCDCRDGSDEPGTSACLNGRFFCRDMQYRPVYLPSAYVNDSICEKQALNEPSSSSIDSNQQSFTHDNDNTLIEHEASSLSDTESHEKKASEYDGHHVGGEDSHMDYDESNVAVTDKQLDDESHHGTDECIDNDFSLL